LFGGQAGGALDQLDEKLAVLTHGARVHLFDLGQAGRLSGWLLAMGHSECSLRIRLRGTSRLRASRSRQAHSSRSTASC
jgi:hypothetical protein